jgi:hypothetical protein
MLPRIRIVANHPYGNTQVGSHLRVPSTWLPAEQVDDGLSAFILGHFDAPLLKSSIYNKINYNSLEYYSQLNLKEGRYRGYAYITIYLNAEVLQRGKQYYVFFRVSSNQRKELQRILGTQ